MAFEEEVFPLMVFGVLAVSGLETALGWRILRGKPHTRSKLLGHVLWMLAGFFFLFRCVFANRMGVLADIWSIHNSVSMGLFALAWCASVACLISLVAELVKPEP